MDNQIDVILDGLKQRGLGKNDVPLLCFPFLDWINSYDWSEHEYIEFGSGSSTNYMANIFKSVDTIETDQYYYNKILDSKKDNVKCFYISVEDIEMGNYSIEINEQTVVMIDNDGNRFFTIKTLLTKCKPNIVILDNSEWHINTSKMMRDNNYLEIPFWGIRPDKNIEQCTSVFIKNGYFLPKRNYNFLSINAISAEKAMSDRGVSVHL